MPKKPILLRDLPVFDVDRSSVPPDLSQFADGCVIPMDKPQDWSSFDVVRYVRNRLPVRKVGHAGTLDPLATGLLVLCCGRATKSINQIQQLPKTYVATITFGSSTASYDAASEVESTASWDHLNKERIQEALQQRFSGEIQQVPPIYSALKKNGQRMYELARKGVDFKPDPRNVVIYESEILAINLPEVTLRLTCGKGFYVRSLAHDLGQYLDSAAHLSSLRRTWIGEFSAGQAWTPEQFDRWSRQWRE